MRCELGGAVKWLNLWVGLFAFEGGLGVSGVSWRVWWGGELCGLGCLWGEVWV